jgi:prevent-host-death family protein
MAFSKVYFDLLRQGISSVLVNMLEAKTNLSRLVEAIELGEEREIVIARNGRPVAKLVPVSAAPSERRIGVARGLFEVPDDIDAHNAEVARLFLGEGTGARRP